MRLLISLSSLLLASALVAPGVAFAQAIPDRLPGSTDPGRLEERLMPTPPMLESEAPQPVATAPVLEDAADGFILRAADFVSNTAFDTAALNSLIAPYLGRRIDENGAQALADYLTAHYREAGYFLSKVFVQDIDKNEGVVTFFAVEGYIEQVEFRNDGVDLSGDWQNIIGRMFDTISAMKPLHGPTLERKLLLLNDMYGIEVETTLVPLVNMPDPPVGAIGMVVDFHRATRLSSVEYNNYGSVFTGPTQGLYTFNVGTPLGSFDNLSLQFLHALPFDEMRYAQIEYTLPIDTDGLILAAHVNKALLRPTANLKAFDLKSDAESIGIDASYPLIRSRAKNLYLKTGFELRNSQTNLLGTEFYDDRLRVVYAGASYEFMDSSQGYNILGATVTQGLDIFGARETGSINLSRQEGHSDFTKFEMTATRFHPLPRDLLLVGGIQGQYALTPLLSSEEFGYGGQMAGRAYDSSEIAGDHGLAAFAEIRYGGLPPVEALDLQIEPYAFYDIGKVWNIDNGAKPESGASAGAGVRFNANSGIFGSAQMAVPLTRSVENPSSGDGDDARFFFQVGARF